MKSDDEKRIIIYRGNAEDIICPAEKLGWHLDEDQYVDEQGYIDWDKVLDKATAFLKKLGVTIEYN